MSDAHRSRDECEAALLFSFYVKNMPTGDVRTLNELQVDRLLERTLTTQRLRASDIDPNQLIDEVKLEYAQSMNGMLLREGLQRPPLRDKMPSTMSLLTPPPPPVPELGVIQIAESSVVGSRASFVAISSLVMPQACDLPRSPALSYVLTRCQTFSYVHMRSPTLSLCAWT